MGIEISDRMYDAEFVRKLEEISGENFHKCMQCGTCTAACPLTENSDVPPRQIILFSHFGCRKRVEESKMIWLCATCQSCTVSCPRGIDLTKVMEAARMITLRRNENHLEPSSIPEEDLEEMPQIAMVSCFRRHTS